MVAHPSAHFLDSVPLVANPSVSLPPKVELPQDIHPLPPDVTPYFVYPFALENYVLDPPAPHLSHHAQLQEAAQLLERQELTLKENADSKEKRRKEQLRKVAPGWAGGADDILQPEQQHPSAFASTSAYSSPAHRSSNSPDQPSSTPVSAPERWSGQPHESTSSVASLVERLAVSEGL